VDVCTGEGWYEKWLGKAACAGVRVLFFPFLSLKSGIMSWDFSSSFYSFLLFLSLANFSSLLRFAL
jgi:hypothetical protein